MFATANPSFGGSEIGSQPALPTSALIQEGQIGRRIGIGSSLFAQAQEQPFVRYLLTVNG
jgi:hypothetical protein